MKRVMLIATAIACLPASASAADISAVIDRHLATCAYDDGVASIVRSQPTVFRGLRVVDYFSADADTGSVWGFVFQASVTQARNAMSEAAVERTMPAPAPLSGTVTSGIAVSPDRDAARSFVYCAWENTGHGDGEEAAVEPVLVGPAGALGIYEIGGGGFSLEIDGKEVLRDEMSYTIDLQQTLAPGIGLLAFSSGGTACPALYRIIDLSGVQPILTEEFGNCSDIPNVTLGNRGVQLVFPGGENPDETYVYAGGKVTQTK